MMESGAYGAEPVLPPDPPPSGQEDQAQIRDRILRQFEAWLDEVLQGERPVEGIAAQVLEQLRTEPAAGAPEAAEAGCDLYSLWSVVTAMVEETRLQGRAFKQLHDSLGPMRELVGSADATLQRYAASLDQQDQRINESTRQAVLQDVLATLIDVRDRLNRGADSAHTWLEQAQQIPKSGRVTRLWRRIFPPPARIPTPHQEAVGSLLKGYHLGREVVDEALTRFGVRPMDCLGCPFDPGTMKAVDIEPQSDADDGTVLEVYRQGYWWNEAVYRPAEVKVARRRQEGPLVVTP
jgi:molecular chaperone GrpE (heat shock protein)